jgi:hypothetical protein
MILGKPAALKIEPSSGASANPLTFAPRIVSQRLIQAPLNPVWPVTNTRRPRQNSDIEAKPVIAPLPLPHPGQIDGDQAPPEHRV